ncbi:helix-turn-helix transcriptional regulator [Streptomyces sp. CHD11]|nr:helix-turn-helix transcriptional regulator [Streptomyces sp. CHD11]
MSRLFRTHRGAPERRVKGGRRGPRSGPQRFARLAAAAAPVRPSPLSERETEVAALVSRGRTNAEIAAVLHISAGTVKTHLTNIQGKLGARDRVEIAAWAWESGLAR